MKKLLLTFVGLFTILLSQAATINFASGMTIPGLATTSKEASDASVTWESTDLGVTLNIVQCYKGSSSTYLMAVKSKADISFTVAKAIKKISIITPATGNLAANGTLALYVGDAIDYDCYNVCNENSTTYDFVPTVKEANTTYHLKNIKNPSANKDGNVQIATLIILYEGETEEEPKPVENVKVANIGALLDANKDLAVGATSTDVFELTGEVTAIYQNQSNLFVKDETGFMLLWGSSSVTYSNGDVIPAGITGQYQNYNGLPEFKISPASLKAGTAGTPVEPIVADIDDPAADGLNSYVIFKDVTISGVNGKNFTISQGKLTVPGYNQFGITISEGEHLNVTGIVSYFNKVQIQPIEITTASGEEMVAAPTFSPAAGEVAAGTAVTLKSATEGASIYYTLDGSVPTTASTLYSEPIVVNAATTVNAIAVKEGMANSAVATAEYTIAGEKKNVAMFDFTQPATLTPSLPANKDAEGLEVTGDNKQYIVTGMNFTSGSVIVTNTKGSTDAKEYYQSGGAIQLRLYNGGATTVSSADPENPITKIVFTYNNGATSYSKVTAPAVGTFDKGTWTGEATSVTFACTGTQQINKIEVTCKNDMKEMAAAPIFSVAAGEVEAGTKVGISTATEGASIYFTTDGTEPTTSSTLYSSPIVINETTTVKAIAVKSGLINSCVTTAAYEVPVIFTVNSVTETTALEDNAKVLINYPLTVAYINASNIFAQDAEGNFIQIYRKNTTFNVVAGDVIPAGWTAVYMLYSGSTPQLEPVGELPAATTGAFTPVTVEASAINAQMVNAVVKVENVIFAEGTPATRTNFTGTVGDVSLTMRNNYLLDASEAGTYNVTVVVAVYNKNVQLYPIAYEFVSGDISGIDSVIGDQDVPVEYFNLQGVPVEHPATGLYIKRQGSKVTKVVIRN
ncbi:MAG: chitobiase/beta-hexosaminidase C-terminal domain-containing protein [Clostridiales bacterium]|nr:chitobiase/beta-hexosaminidase C-terminal domain-containing protein [Clostridiales bacterium]